MTIKALSLSLKHTFSRSSSSTTNTVHHPGTSSKKQQRPPLATTPGNNDTDQDITFSKKGGVTSIRTATPIPNKPRSSNGTAPPSPAPANTTNSKHTNHDLLLDGIGPYQFLHTLGNGKFSRVILAKHRETRQLVAIKIIDKQAHDYRVMSRLVREIHLMELLEHPNIVKLYETFETSDSLFLVMEYVAGQNLDEYLQQRGGVLSESEARHLFRQLIQAIHTCHRHWIVHRDLKTPNILISKDQKRKVMGDDGKEIEVPVLKLADFGLGNRFGLQRLRTICGSMLYYSPEIISNQKYYGPEVDCWCLGIALFRMTAGFEPFAHAHTVGELKRDVCSCNFPMPASLSPALQTTILKCLQVDRRRRMTVRHALYNDPWLTKNGQLPCPLESPTIYDDLIQTQQYQGEGSDLTAKDKERRTRRQLMKALEQEQPRVKRTLIYHPINASTYFTTISTDSSTSGAAAPTTVASSGSLEVPTTVNEASSSGEQLSTTAAKSMAAAATVHRYDRHVSNVECYRSELLQLIRHKTNILGLKSTEKWHKMFMVRPQQLLHLKSTLSSQSKPNVSLFSISSASSSSMDQASSQQKQEKATNSSSTNSNGKLFSWTQMMQRIQDQVYYFHVDDASAILASVAATASSGSSSSSLPTSASARPYPQTTANTATTAAEQQQREELMSGTLVGQEPPLPSLTLSSITTSGSIDEPLDSSSSSYQNNSNNNPLNTTHHPQKHHHQQQYVHSHGVSMHYLTTQLEKECMELLKQTCQLMGITYHQDESKRLVCVLTLRDAPSSLQQSEHQQPEQQAQKPLQRRSSKNSTASTQRSYTSTSTGRSRSSHSYEELILGGGGTYPTNASTTRFQLPLISHLTSSMTTSFFNRKQNTTLGTSDTAMDAAQQQQESRKKDGVAVFTMTLEMLLVSPSSSSSSSSSSSTKRHRHHSSVHRQQHVIALRFSKVQGSTTVFKMAGGWITGVLGLDGKLAASHQS